MKSFILIAAALLQTAIAAPQFINFKDGKVGVNFFGYHAEAGLGGGPNGGGLHASAGTPWGQNAAAGLGGNVNGRASGILYAGAQATPDVGADAVLGGDTSRGGFSGTSSYVNGKVKSHTRTIVPGNTPQIYANAEPNYPPSVATESDYAIQKIRPPKKYYPSESQQPAKRQLIARQAPQDPSPCEGGKCKTINREMRPDTVQNALQIPIGILQSLQQSLGNLASQPK